MDMFQNSFLYVVRIHQKAPSLSGAFYPLTVWHHVEIPFPSAIVPTIWLQHILKVKGKSQARWHKSVISAFGSLRQNHLQFQADMDYNWKTTSKNREKLSCFHLPRVTTSQYP